MKKFLFTPIGAIIVMILILVVVGGVMEIDKTQKIKNIKSQKADTSKKIRSLNEILGDNKPEPKPIVQDDTPVLEVSGFKLTEDDVNWFHTTGRVQNISNRRLENVMALASFFDKAHEFVDSDSAPIEYHTLMPGQFSPFTITTSPNSAIQSVIIEFHNGATNMRYEHVFKKKIPKK